MCEHDRNSNLCLKITLKTGKVTIVLKSLNVSAIAQQHPAA